MNRVTISAAEAPLPKWSGSLRRYAGKVLAELGRDKWDLSVLLCDDVTISGLNSRYRGKPEATDVLSFAQNEGEPFPGKRLPGDIVISLDTLSKNARRFAVSEDEELRRLVIHGILHLDGMNHRSNRSTEPMLQLQENILSKLSDEHIIGRWESA